MSRVNKKPSTFPLRATNLHCPVRGAKRACEEKLTYNK
jgi:hypothetical protein